MQNLHDLSNTGTLTACMIQVHNLASGIEGGGRWVAEKIMRLEAALLEADRLQRQTAQQHTAQDQGTPVYTCHV